MNRLLTLCMLSLLALPTSVMAAGFEARDLAGCKLPVLSGARTAGEMANSTENGNLFFESGGKQQWVFWLAGANEELNPKTLAVYADALGKSGAWLGAAEATWEEVDGTKAARLPFKLSKEQPVNGQMLAWAHVPSGRIFMLGVTPPWSKQGVSSVSSEVLGALLTEAAPLVDCSGAGATDRGLAMFEVAPRGYGVDTSDPPRLYYNKPGHALVLWRAGRGDVSSDVSCTTPAETVFDAFAGPLTLTYKGDINAVVDNFGGKADGPLCDVQRSVTGFTDQEGDTARYVMYPCPNADGAVAALEFGNPDVAKVENRADVFAAICGNELPPEPEPEPETPAAEKKQWTPGQ